MIVSSTTTCFNLRRIFSAAILTFFASWFSCAHADTPNSNRDWSQFRGPDSLSTTTTQLPHKWSIDDGILWKRALPGRGASTPIVSEDQIFLTAYTGYGLSMKQPGNPNQLQHHLIALDRDGGAPRWQRTIKGTPLKQRMNVELARHGFASATPVTDGENVYAFFGVTGVFAFRNDGTTLWQRNVGIATNYFGSSASPVLHQDLCIVNASIESDSIYAFDKQTGIAVWKIDDVQECWAMPVIGKNSAGSDEMIISSKNKVSSYDPKTGKLLWSCPGIKDYVVSTPIIVDGVCYLTGGKQKQTMAIRMGAVSDEDRKIWEIPRFGSNVSSPVYHDGKLFIFHDSGNIQVIDATNGKLIKRKRSGTRQRPFASPLLSGAHLFMPFQDTGIEVLKAGPKCERVALNKVPDDAPLMASIVPDADRFLFRSDEYLCCVGFTKSKTKQSAWTQPEDHQTIEACASFNIDPANGKARRYLNVLGPDFKKAIKTLMLPYTSVITQEQIEEGTRLIEAEQPRYASLRKTLLDLRWKQATTPIADLAELTPQWESLEAATLDLNRQTRNKVKKLLSKEQLDQHLADAKAKKAHLKPQKK